MKADRRALFVLMTALPLLGGAAETDPLDFSLGELVTQEVITVARKRQEIGNVAAAVHVVSAEDIERMGVTTLPDALRLVPGVHVAASSNNRWAVSVRGFNGRFANSLLVMVDGQTGYSPLFSGTFWEALDIPLAEVDRIEVIRGPGASIWGANAVNGIVNIITKWARATQGRELGFTAGTVDKARVYARQGGALDEGHYRVSYHGRARGASYRLGGGDGEDRWRTHRLGLRMERFLGGIGEVSLTADVHRNDSEDYWNVPDVSSPTLVTGTPLLQRDQGAGLTARLSRIFDDGSEWSLQGSVQYIDKAVGDLLHETRHSVDVDGQYRFSRGRHDLIVGAGVRYNDQTVVGSDFFQVDNANSRFGLVSAFVHDEIALLPETLTLTAGLKFEHHSWTGNEWQPNVRMAWQLARNHMLWGAVSEASRTPARVEFDMSYAPLAIPASTPPVTALPKLTRFSNAESLRAERIRAYEVGYRGQPSPTTHVDVTAFLNRYRHLRSLVSGSIYPAGGWLVVDNMLAFNTHGTTGGLEASLDWQPSTRWRTRLTYTHLDTRVDSTGTSLGDSASAFYMQRVPRDQFGVHVTWKPRTGHAVDAMLRHVAETVYSETGRQPVAAYTELDLQYGWRVSPTLTLSITGRNLLDARHAEFDRDYMPAAVREVERSVHFSAQWALD